MPTTTIKVDAKTRDALQALKGRYTYDELLEMLLKLVPEGDDEGTFRPEFRLSLLEAKLDDSPPLSFDELKAELGMP